MAHLRDLIVNGNSRTFGTAYATKFEGPLTGNATSATKATQDGNGNTITSTYATASSLSSHTGNKSNPHGVTKAQVGLGSVANIDQSKAIKSITRSGTTFTATALDGTTTTFTQQDNNTTYGDATTSSHGLMTAAMVSKLNGIANGANAYTHPSYTAHASGLYKVTVDGSGHVSATTAVTKADITALGIPGQDTNTTYGVVSSSSNGLMSPALLNTLNSVNSAIGGKYSSSGGTLNGNLMFPNIGDTGESKGVGWTGSGDTAWIYYRTTAKDTAHLVLNPGDDSNDTVDFEWNHSTKSYITSDGVYHGTATYANSAGSANSVAWNNVSGKPSTYYTHPSYTAHGTGLYKVAVDAQGHVSGVAAVTKSDITALGIPGQDTNTTYTLAGLGGVAKSGDTMSGNLSFTTIGDKATSAGIVWDGSTDGAKIYYKTTEANHGHLVLQASDDGNETIDFEWITGSTIATKSYISSDGVYHGTATYANSAGSANSVAWNNISGKPSTYYTHPSYASHASGLYKVTVDGSGHVSAVSNVTKADITALGIPGQDTNTTYTLAGLGGVAKSGDTMRGPLNFANGTKNVVGDDVAIGDFNQGGSLGIQGLNGTTTVSLLAQGGSWDQSNAHMDMVYNTTDQCCDFKFK